MDKNVSMEEMEKCEKYRRIIIYNKLRKDIVEILRTLYRYKGVELLERYLMEDHVHI